MKNYILMNGNTVWSKPVTKEEAEKRIADMKHIIPTLTMIETDEDVKVESNVKHGPAEVIEDVGCAGGACTL